jgi:hypothetical protein
MLKAFGLLSANKFIKINKISFKKCLKNLEGEECKGKLKRAIECLL